MDRKLALVDIDNTLNLFDATCVVVAHNLYGVKVDETFCSWGEALYNLSPEERMNVFRTAHSPYYINILSPLGGSVEALREISEDFDIVYLSDRHVAAHDDTVAWLRQHEFPQPENLVCSADKRDYMKTISSDIAFIVDDRPRTLIFARYELGLPHVFSIKYRYNENLSDIPGIHLSATWADILTNYQKLILAPSVSNL